MGVDVARFRPPSAEERLAARRELAGRFGFDPRAPVVSFVGALVRRKGIDLLVSAWPAVVAAVPGATLLLVGPTEDAGGSHEFSPAFIDRVLGTTRSSAIIPTGPVEDPVPVYHASDVFVLPSRGEGLPNVVLEALASGLAPVVTDLPGVAGEVVADGRTGLVVPCEDPAALSRAIVSLLSNADLRAAIGARGRQVAAERFAFERVAAATAAEYAELAGGSRAPHD